MQLAPVMAGDGAEVFTARDDVNIEAVHAAPLAVKDAVLRRATN